MEILIVLGIIIVFMVVLGISFLPIISAVLWMLEGMALLSLLFFLITAGILLFTKKRAASFEGLEKIGKYGLHAIYKVEGEEYNNQFPTDPILKNLLYRKKEVTVRVLKMREKLLVFDAVSQLVVWIGLPAFAVISLLFWRLIA